MIDGDTFALDEQIIRLYAIDAPEMAQRCDGGPKEMRHCGAYVADRLAEWVGGQSMTCTEVTVDDYGRSVARCSVNGTDLATWMVSEGLAAAFRRYADEQIENEEEAKEREVGLWRPKFQPPWEFRAKRREVAKQKAPESCPIKGNINRDNGERIYHTPWGSQWYDRTKISVSKGERWFCDEREALDAGWRAPSH